MQKKSRQNKRFSFSHRVLTFFCLCVENNTNRVSISVWPRRHQGPIAGSTPEPNRRYATLPHNLVSRTSSAPSPSLQRRISTNTPSSSYLKSKGRRFNVQLKKGKGKRTFVAKNILQHSHKCDDAKGVVHPKC